MLRPLRHGEVSAPSTISRRPKEGLHNIVLQGEICVFNVDAPKGLRLGVAIPEERLLDVLRWLLAPVDLGLAAATATHGSAALPSAYQLVAPLRVLALALAVEVALASPPDLALPANVELLVGLLMLHLELHELAVGPTEPALGLSGFPSATSFEHAYSHQIERAVAEIAFAVLPLRRLELDHPNWLVPLASEALRRHREGLQKEEHMGWLEVERAATQSYLAPNVEDIGNRGLEGCDG